MSEPGKKFELDFKNSAPDTVFVYRLKTRITPYKGDTEIADYLVYQRPELFVFELKSTKEQRLPFSMLRTNQVLGIREAVYKHGIAGGFVVQLRDPYSHWYIPIQVFDKYVERGKKSILLSDMQNDNDIIEIKFTMKRVTCKLDVQDLLNKIKERNDANNITGSIGN